MNVLTHLSAHELSRLSLLFAHLLCCVFALSIVISSDVRMLLRRISVPELDEVAHVVSRLLIGLWVTGLAVIGLDTGFDPAVLAGKSKLLFKFICAVALTLNGILLHMVTFPLVRRGQISTAAAAFLGITGALSSSHWLLAAFVGIGKSLANVPLPILLTAWSALLIACFVGGALAAPWLKQMIARLPAQPRIALEPLSAVC